MAWVWGVCRPRVSDFQSLQISKREGWEQTIQNLRILCWSRISGKETEWYGDDDGLRLPPKIAPQQVVILPMLREKPEDDALIEYCEALRATLAGQSAFGEPLRVLLDTRPGKAAQKRWDYVRKGAPIIVEVGGRDMENGVVSMLRRDRLWDSETGKVDFQNPTREVAGQTIPDVLADMQSALLTQAAERRDANVTRGITDFAAVEDHFGASRYPGWVEVQWSKPTGDGLEKVVERLKEHKLTIRNVPMDAAPVDGACIFTGEPAVERVLLAKAY